MKTINRKKHNTLECTCGNVIEYESDDFVLQKTDESDPFYVIGVKCPDCGCLHVLNPDKYDSKALLDMLNLNHRKEIKTFNDLTFAEIRDTILTANHPFKSGDTKEITLKDGSKAVLEIIGFGHDVGANGKQTAVTFCFRELLGENEDGGRTMNEASTNKGGWEKSDMRKYLNEEFFNLLPDELQELIVPVRKTTYNANGKTATVTTDKIFLPSEYEVFGKVYYSAGQEGEQYEHFKYWRNRVKAYTDGEYGRYWWLRSPYSGGSSIFCGVNSNGNFNYNNANSTCGVSPCFAI